MTFLTRNIVFLLKSVNEFFTVLPWVPFMLIRIKCRFPESLRNWKMVGIDRGFNRISSDKYTLRNILIIINDFHSSTSWLENFVRSTELNLHFFVTNLRRFTFGHIV